MQVIRDHLALRNPRFVCRDTKDQGHLVVPLGNVTGPPATAEQLEQLRILAGSEAATLLPFYAAFDGIVLHTHGETVGLQIAAIHDLERLNQDWRSWFADWEPERCYDFQRSGVAFATIVHSGNYFVVHDGRIYYDDHDGGDDAVWADDVEGLLRRALGDPARFLEDVGCYTRYFDGETDTQWIPVRFEHD